ncbi:MAG: tetratricopeptide repeat protein [Gammaproteobacteria bacterium]|nr:tetratricopeptide repeat protein [Gammaproteobacteria bacterium]
MTRNAVIVLLILFSLGTVAADTLFERGLQAFRQGRQAEAVKAWEQALEKGTNLPLRQKHRLRLHLGEACQKLGHIEKALTVLQQSLASGHTEPQLTVLTRLALANLCMQTPVACAENAAEEHLRQAAALLENLDNPALQAALSLNRGNLYALQALQARGRKSSRLGRKALAEFTAKMRAAYLQTAELAEQANNPLLRGKALTNLAGNFHQLGFTSRSFLARLAPVLEILPPTHDKLMLLLRSAELHRHLGKIETAFSRLQAARQLSEILENPHAQALVLGELANLYADNKRYAEALTLWQQALFKTEDPLTRMRWHRQKAELHARLGADDKAIEAYRQAIKYLEQVRPALQNQASGTSLDFEQSVKPLYLAFVDLLLKRAANADREPAECAPLPGRPALSADTPASRCQSPWRITDSCDLRTAQAAMERLKQGELNDYFYSDCAPACAVPLTEALGPDTAAVYHIFLPERIVALVMGENQSLRQVELPVQNRVAEVKAHLASLTRLLRNGASAFLYADSAVRLYDWLIRPLALGPEIKTLVFVPDEHLRNVPLGALCEDSCDVHQGGRFLLQKYALALVPGLSLTEPAARTSGQRLLLGGLAQTHRPKPDYQGRDYRQVPPLFHVKTELDKLRDLVPARSKVLRDADFVSARMHDALQDIESYSMLHIASHAFFERESKQSVILTADDVLGMDGLQRLLQSGDRDAARQLRLLTLSACATAADSPRAALGLAGLTLKTGVPTAVGTLWQVNDRATAVLMEHFYRNLRERPDQSVAHALRAAQLALLEGDAGELKNLFYWAPFVVVGNWIGQK